MKLSERVTQSTRERLRVVDGYYETVERGYSRPMPVLHFHGRTLSGEYRHFSVDGFRPYLLVPRDMSVDLLEDLETDRRVLDIQVADRDGLGGVDLLRVVLEQPYMVRNIRDALHDQGVQTYEADVLFPQRFLIDVGAWSDSSATDYVSIPTDASLPLDPTDVEAEDPDDGVSPRVCTFDLEVYNEGEFPDPAAARQEIIAATAHDSYVGDYIVWVLHAGTDPWVETTSSYLQMMVSGDLGIDSLTVRWFHEERDLVGDMVEYLLERKFDVLGAWNVGFDVPYLVNRCYEHDLLAIEDLSPTQKMDRHEDDGRFINSDITGVHVFDFLKAWDKSLFHTPDSKKLEHAAAVETDMEKLDVDEQQAWREDPESLIKYNVRDVQAVLEINDAKQLL